MKQNASKTLLGLVSAVILGMGGCGVSDADYQRLKESNELIRGTVLAEKYISPGLEKVEERHLTGIVSRAYSNPTVTIGKSIYNITLRTDEGDILILNVLDGQKIPKESVRELIDEGDKIGFSIGNLWYLDKNNDLDEIKPDRKESGFYKKGDQYVSRKPRHIKKL